MLGEEFYEGLAAQREVDRANYCQKCKGTGLDLSNPLICGNCKGTKKRGTGNCHKCTINQQASGYVYKLCPICMPQERVVAILDAKDCVDRTVKNEVLSDHEHGGMQDVRCHGSRR